MPLSCYLNILYITLFQPLSYHSAHTTLSIPIPIYPSLYLYLYLYTPLLSVFDHALDIAQIYLRIGGSAGIIPIRSKTQASTSTEEGLAV
jgi:hypothetical protein